MRNLAAVYDSEELRKIINNTVGHSFKNDRYSVGDEAVGTEDYVPVRPGYVPIGLLVKPPSLEKDNRFPLRTNPDEPFTFQSVAGKTVLNLDVLYYNFDEGFTSLLVETAASAINERATNILKPKSFIISDGGLDRLNFNNQTARDTAIWNTIKNGLTSRPDNLINTIYQYCNPFPDTVLFGRAELNAISMNERKEIVISGMQIDMGTGIHSYSEANYPSLKAESTDEYTVDELVSRFVTGAPCPPFWDETLQNIVYNLLQYPNDFSKPWVDPIPQILNQWQSFYKKHLLSKANKNKK